MSALKQQVGGGHYKDMPIQPAEYSHKNGLGFIEGSVVKYVSRWKNKNGIQDLKKARHFLDLLIEMESESEEIIWPEESDRDLAIGQNGNDGLVYRAMERQPWNDSFDEPKE